VDWLIVVMWCGVVFPCSFTMQILNKKKGPNLFWAICVGCVLINLIIFARSGLLDFEYFKKKELTSNPDEKEFDRSIKQLRRDFRTSVRKRVQSMARGGLDETPDDFENR
jgi:hypothetical protein